MYKRKAIHVQIKGIFWPLEGQRSGKKGKVKRSTNLPICDDMHKHDAQPLTWQVISHPPVPSYELL